MICAYTLQRWEALGEAIRSVRAQRYAATEIVLVVDHAPELEAAGRAAWPELRVVANRERQGLSGARNTGLDEAKGAVVAFLDDDAVAAPDWLERLAAAYADERVIGAGGDVRPHWLEGRPPWFPAEFDWVVGCSHSGMPRSTQRVRNLIGANMSFRRDIMVRAGGFRHELGRVGTIPAGCEETELCIRLAAAWPDGLIMYEPGAVVDHVVPARRASLRYFVSRCGAEGRSKAILAGFAGSAAGLAAERTYVRRTLPVGFLRGLGETVRGRPAGAARAAVLVLGLLATVRGYAAGRRAVRAALPPPAAAGAR
ncbi:MAG: glucosyl-dolichyl phosphate glucuronosyltransferase [bacterium]